MDEAIKQLRRNIPKNSHLSSEAKEQIKQLEEAMNKAETDRKEMANTIEVIRNTIPYNRFIMTQDLLITLDDKNFRDAPEIIAFKYGGCISIFGYVTNIISAEDVPPQVNDFAGIYTTINQVMLSLFKERDKIFIIHPVTLFY